MDLLLSFVLNGLVYGVLLFLTAAGLSMIVGLMNVVSLVHGSFFMLGAYVGLTLYNVTGSFWWALLLAWIPSAVAGAAIEIACLRPLYRRGHLDQVLLTFGFTFVFSDLVQTIWGRDNHALPPPGLFESSVEVLGGLIPSYRLFIIGFGLLLAAALWALLDRSRLGAMVRAGVDDSATAEGLGINVSLLFTSVFAMGAGMAALAGVVAGPVLGLSLGMDVGILIPAFIVIVIGGMGSLRGALVGSLLVGQADTLGRVYLPDLQLFLIYLLMIAVLLWRPQGLFGLRKPAGAPAWVDKPAAPARRPLGRGERRLLGGLGAVALLVLPALFDNYALALFSEVFIFSVFALSLDLLIGYTGLISFGHATFFALGAYAVIILNLTFGLDPLPGVLVGVLVATLGAAVIGYFCTKVSGIAFLMLTMAFSQLLYSLALRWREVTGGTDGIGGIPSPEILGWTLSGAVPTYYLTAATLALGFWVMRRIAGSPLGHVLVGIRENEARMRAIGYPVTAFKLASFTVGGALAGLAGGIYAIFNGFISPDALTWGASGDVMIMVVLGGMGTSLGPIVGTAFFLLAKNFVSSHSEHWMLIVGLLFVACVLFFRDGIYGSLSQLSPIRMPFRRKAVS
ncbi:ABC transporter permease [Roseomonas sp. BN140053]|uniref:ABC transporter permease n=1 Tax=Roseomonas sp. BN140053 TaxID=3391898 RepID=UPI0039EBDAA3